MQITVQKIWPLDPTKKSGGFKATDGVNYYCEIGAYHLVQEGVTYEADPTPYVSKLGKSSFIMPKNWHPPAALVGGSAPPTSPPYPPTNTSQPTPPRPAANGSAPPYFSEIEKSGYIFVTGCLQQALGSGKCETKDISFVAQTLVAAWNDHIKGKI